MPMLTYLSQNKPNLTEEWMVYVLIGIIVIGSVLTGIILHKFKSK